MPYQNEVKPLNLFGDFLAGKQAAISQQAGQQQNALRGLQVQQGQQLNALAQNPNATPEQYARAGDPQTAGVLNTMTQQGQVDKLQAAQELGMLAQKTLALPAEQRKAFTQQAMQTYGPHLQSLGVDVNQALGGLMNVPDAEFEANLQRAAQFAAPQPIQAFAADSTLYQGGKQIGTTAPSASFQETSRHNRATEAQAAANAAREGSGGKPPTGYRTNADGSLEFIPGGPADPNVGKGKFTDSERLSAAYATRMRKAADLISSSDYVPSTADMVKFNYLLGGPGVKQSLANMSLSPEAQQYIQAVQDFNRAKLRKESGSAIQKEEVFGDLATFFPIPGDDKKTLAQKTDARETAIAGMIGTAGGAYSAPQKSGNGWTVKKVK